MSDPMKDPLTWWRHAADWAEMAIDCKANASESNEHGHLSQQWYEMADLCERRSDACRQTALMLKHPFDRGGPT